MATTRVPLYFRARAEIERRKKLETQSQADDAQTWREWLAHYFIDFIASDFAPHHVAFWEWVWQLEKGVRPNPFVAIWSRGGAKSSSAELAAAMCAIRRKRKYCVYVSETQDQADKHVATVATLLESAKIERALNRYGNSKGWRRNRLRTAQGATIDALGLDTAARGIKVDADRPDMIILDDVDGRHDSSAATVKKIETLTTTILPAGSNDCAVLFVQNLIHPDSIASRLCDGRADFLSDRIVSGPYKAIDNLRYEARDGEYVIVAGTPTWEGQSVKVAEGQIKTWGLQAFLREAQHEVERVTGAIYADAWDDANVTESADYIPGGGEVIWAVDDGYTGEWIPDAQNYTANSHPRVFLLAQIRQNGIVAIFAESHKIKTLEETHIAQVLAMQYPRPTRAVVDKSAAALRGRLHTAGIYTVPGANSVDESIKNMRAWIAPDVNGVRRLIVHPRCKLFLREVKLYSADDNGVPIKQFDHTQDACRYLLWSLRNN